MRSVGAWEAASTSPGACHSAHSEISFLGQVLVTWQQGCKHACTPWPQLQPCNRRAKHPIEIRSGSRRWLWCGGSTELRVKGWATGCSRPTFAPKVSPAGLWRDERGRATTCAPRACAPGAAQLREGVLPCHQVRGSPLRSKPLRFAQPQGSREAGACCGMGSLQGHIGSGPPCSRTWRTTLLRDVPPLLAILFAFSQRSTKGGLCGAG